MSSRPDIVVPPSLPPALRQVLTAVVQRLKAVEADLATKVDQETATATARLAAQSVASNTPVRTPVPAGNVIPVTADQTASVIGTYLADATAADVTLTLPSAKGRKGQRWTFTRVDASANIVTLAAAGSETINGDPSFDLTDQWESVVVTSDGANWVIV